MFVVLKVESTPNHLRGYVSRFLQEVDTGIYVGVCTRKVIDNLWEQITANSASGSAVLVEQNGSLEMGFRLRIHAVESVKLKDFDGLTLPVKVAAVKQNTTKKEEEYNKPDEGTEPFSNEVF